MFLELLVLLLKYMNAALAVAHTDKYLGHIIANNLSDESEMYILCQE